MEATRSHRPPLSRWVARTVLVSTGFFTIAIAPFAKADTTDVALLYVEKTLHYLQTEPGTPPLLPNPVTIKIGANRNSNRPNSITSGTVQIPPPVNTTRPLANEGNGNFVLQAGNFPDIATLNASFPNGRYSFSLQTITGQTGYVNDVSINGDSYPTTVPEITGGNWSTGGLQIDPTQDYDIFWNTFVTPNSTANSAVVLRIVDDKGALVFRRDLTKDVSTVTIPAGLQPGRYYTASLVFQNIQVTFTTPFNRGLGIYSSRTDFTIATIGAPPVVSGPSTPLGTVGQMFVYQIIASDHPFSYDASALPDGLTLDSTLGIISGIPTKPETVPAILSASNINGTGTKTNFAPTIQPSPSSGPVIISSTSALGFAGQPFEFQVLTRGATSAARITADVPPGLPAGLTLDPVTGEISGTTNAVGSFTVNLSLTDGGVTVKGFVQLTFTADAGYPVITNANIVVVPRNQAFSYKIETPGANDPADPPAYTMFGTLPPGLGFDAATGIISGTYTGPLSQKNATKSGGDPPPDIKPLSGGALLGSVQLFSTNSHGTSTFQLLFLAPPSGAVNISTRLFVGTGENVLIGGFIVTGNAPKVVIIRAIGPSLGISGALQDPMLALHNSAGGVVSNDNWRTTQEQIIKDTTIPPADNRECAIVIGLDPGNYTAILSGKNDSTGIALVEVYDLGTASLDAGSKAQLAQISTRGNVLQGDNVMIGGFIVSGTTTKVIARAIGPSLSAFGVGNALANTTLELFNSSGTSIGFNDDWRSDQEQAIIDTTVPPTNNLESAIVSSLVPGPYTAIVRGKNNLTGVALVEVFGLP